MWQRVEYLASDGLIKMGSNKMDGFANYRGMIQSITPEGRVFLERIENNRFSRRIADWFMGIIAGLVIAALVKYLGLDS